PKSILSKVTQKAVSRRYARLTTSVAGQRKAIVGLSLGRRTEYSSRRKHWCCATTATVARKGSSTTPPRSSACELQLMTLSYRKQKSCSDRQKKSQPKTKFPNLWSTALSVRAVRWLASACPMKPMPCVPAHSGSTTVGQYSWRCSPTCRKPRHLRYGNLSPRVRTCDLFTSTPRECGWGNPARC